MIKSSTEFEQAYIINDMLASMQIPKYGVYNLNNIFNTYIHCRKSNESLFTIDNFWLLLKYIFEHNSDFIAIIATPGNFNINGNGKYEGINLKHWYTNKGLTPDEFYTLINYIISDVDLSIDELIEIFNAFVNLYGSHSYQNSFRSIQNILNFYIDYYNKIDMDKLGIFDSSTIIGLNTLGNNILIYFANFIHNETIEASKINKLYKQLLIAAIPKMCAMNNLSSLNNIRKFISGIHDDYDRELILNLFNKHLEPLKCTAAQNAEDLSATSIEDLVFKND